MGEIKAKVIQKAISLETYGINDLAWSKEDALELIYSIIRDRIGVLGGDVYKLASHRLEPLYDNWACERSKTESEDEYFLRSKTETLRYIENYPVQSEEKIVFSITFTEKIK